MKSQALKRKRYATTFGSFVRAFGIPELCEALTEKLGEKYVRQRVYNWVYCKTQPGLKELNALIELSKTCKVQISISDINEHFTALKSINKAA